MSTSGLLFGHGEKLPTFVFVVKQQSLTHTFTLLLCNVRINTPLFDYYENYIS